ncbi:MAG: hypothetical protein HY602_01065, partial [Parcubacteria group bacterium]|nr:hypothetical protein [Parcubacteria group bacterium]
MARMYAVRTKTIWTLLSKHLVLMSLAIVLFMAGIGYFLVFGRQIQRIQANDAEEKSKAIQLEEAKKYLADLNRLYQSYAAIPSAHLDKLDQMFPQGENIPDLLVWLEAAASQNGLRMLDIAIIPEGAAAEASAGFSPGLSAAYPEISKPLLTREASVKPKGLQISISVSGGNYNAIKSFLADIENSLRVMDILSFGYAPKLSEYKISIRTYF